MHTLLQSYNSITAIFLYTTHVSLFICARRDETWLTVCVAVPPPESFIPFLIFSVDDFGGEGVEGAQIGVFISARLAKMRSSDMAIKTANQWSNSTV